MADWDIDSQQLRSNLVAALESARRGANSLETPSLQLARNWHLQMFEGLTPPEGADVSWYGNFRGDANQEFIGVRVGLVEGVPPESVLTELKHFIDRFTDLIAGFDETLSGDGSAGNELPKVRDGYQLRAVIGLMAYAHGEWIRIHPFANGNGRTARLWANWVAMRYGLPPFVTLRPRPDGSYEQASRLAMGGDWKAMRPVFESMVDELADDILSAEE